MVKFLAICRNTFVETTRQPIYGVLIAVTFAVLVMAVPLSTWSMGDGAGDYHTTDQKMLASLGLATLLVAGLLIAAFSASSAVTREIEDKTALTVISKPVSRTTFVLGKFAGVTGAVGVAFYLCALVFLMTVRHQVVSTGSDEYDIPVIVIGICSLALALATAVGGNYLFAWPFISAVVRASLVLLTLGMGVIGFVGKGWKIVPFGTDINPQLLVAMGLIFMAVLILTAVAVAASTRLGQLMTLLVCTAFFFAGTTHPYLFGEWAAKAPLVRWIGWIAPNLTFFYPLDALALDKPIPAQYAALAGAYGVCYIAALLAIGVALFQTRELEAQGTSGTLPGAVAILGWSGRAAAVLGGIVALVMLSMHAHHTLVDISIGVAVLAGAAAVWGIFSRFGQGARWSWWIVAILAFIGVAGSLAVLFVPGLGNYRAQGGPPRLVCAAVVSGVVLILTILPKTRRHFVSEHP